ncbi:DUF6083 domain-containing protein [Streptomyces sp. TX20-6-3]|uniref:DUF6083 domain-containing protein n=1 Tax=Streptomyces sp. TX20-6-3 TaxID=3028705 RepID=UPI0029A6E2EA|nr:DUF6083 domain-containing protein [Streptomyces sp. TX20-6-3]MDX2562356.1 DUF6083 domain-containing protein [Streptomyces sp. TX20-6-3]
MGSGRRNDECDSCGAPYGTWVPSLGMVLCPQCEGAGAAHPVRDPVLVGDVLAGLVDTASFAVRGGGVVRDVPFGEAIRDVRRAAVGVPEPRSGGSAPSVPRAAGPAGSVCRRCGGRGAWYRTVRGRWIMIEPGEPATAAVPAGSRWRIAGDGTAVNLGSAVPSDTCRVSHFDVCAASPEPVGSPVLLALWRRHARRTA